MNQSKLSFKSENLVVDWISFNIAGFSDPKIIGDRLFPYFNVSITMVDQSKIRFYDRRNIYNASIREHSKGHWIGSQIIFSGENATYFYKLIKTQKFNWSILKFDQCTLGLGRIDLCFSRPNDFNHTSELFDAFLVDSRSQIQNNTNTRHIKLQDFPDGKILKVNRRNNSVHYRVYQKNQNVRFEIELKHRKTKLVQDYLFHNQLDVFEDILVIQHFQYSKRVLRLDSIYTDWVVNFQRKHLGDPISRSLVTSYLENQVIKNQEEEEEERLFHLLQFLSFVKSLELNPLKGCKKVRIKKQFYYELKFTGMQLSNKSKRKNLIVYFYQFQKLDPIVKVFSNMAFRSYVCFPYVDYANPSGKSWVLEVLVVEELFCFPYPFRLPKSFLRSGSKNDLRLKVRLMKSLAVSNQKKILDLEEFFNTINVRNDPLIQIKKNLIRLLNELVENEIIQNEVLIVLKSYKNKDRLIQNLTTSDITRRIKYIQFHEIHRKSVQNFGRL
jgi:hypothetical protein